MSMYQDHMKAWMAIILIAIGVVLLTTALESLGALGVLSLASGFVLMLLSSFRDEKHHKKTVSFH